MPYFVKQAATDAGLEPESVYLDRRPQWRDRSLDPAEVYRCSTLVLLALEHRGLAHRQIAEAVMALGGRKAKDPEVREAAAMIPTFLAAQRFDDEQVDQVIGALKELVPAGCRAQTGKSAVGARLRRMKADAAAHGFELGPIP
jgi:hypothetical protein